MFGKSDKSNAGSEVVEETPAKAEIPRPGMKDKLAVIGPTITIKGEIKGHENMLIQGCVEGAITLQQSSLTVGKEGHVKADVHANIIIVEGHLEGDLCGDERVVIRHTGNVCGNIVSPRVSLDDGANFKGSIDMEPNMAKQSQPSSQSEILLSEIQVLDKRDTSVKQKPKMVAGGSKR